MSVTLDDIRAAAAVLDGEVIRTPLIPSPRLSRRLGCELYLKLENLQYTGSFKDRGALVKLKGLNEEQAKRGVIAMSAGNHAQGVAYHAKRLGIPATIVMPEFAPFTKVEQTRKFGAKVLLTGDTLDASAVAAREIMAKEGLAFVHPYDDPAIVAGQGTIGLEIMADQPDLDDVIVPIGGGGVLSGTATAMRRLGSPIVRSTCWSRSRRPSTKSRISCLVGSRNRALTVKSRRRASSPAVPYSLSSTIRSPSSSRSTGSRRKVEVSMMFSP